MAHSVSSRSKAELVSELSTMRRRVAELETTLHAREGTERELRDLGRELRERVKELNCLLSISRLRDLPGASTRTLLEGIVNLIPPAWQYPEVTCARIRVANHDCRTRNYRQTPWKLVHDITVQGERVGTVDVHYTQAMPPRDIGPFLTEERNLLEAIAERIARVVEQERNEERSRQQQQQMVQLDKMVALGTLVSGVAHEINNPNNFVMLNTPVLAETYESIQPILDEYSRQHGDFLVGGLPYSEMRDAVPSLFSGILEGSRRISSIVQSLKDFARAETSGYREPVDMNCVINSALVLVGNLVKRKTTDFSVRLANGLPRVKGNAQRLEQVVINLIQNACESLQGGAGRVVVATAFDDRNVMVTVQDDGCGIPESQLPLVTDPFYTSKRAVGGTGLGLSVSLGIVNEHEGTLAFRSVEEEGTTATLTFPIWSERPAVREVRA